MPKLKQLLGYIKGTLDMPYVVGGRGHLGRMETWLDAAYAARAPRHAKSDQRSHFSWTSWQSCM